MAEPLDELRDSLTGEVLVEGDREYERARQLVNEILQAEGPEAVTLRRAQDPVARLHYRGHPNRGLRVLEVEGEEIPAYDAELTLDGKAVGRITSAVPGYALAYIRVEVPDAAQLEVEGRPARLH